ncbi:sensor histidine kinase [Hymenobacter sp. BT664]|uniref:Sensor histidine kinase n=1 Tax=Hymenobacter montanus TaxID=2771359 RepID=A0A927BG89_9BACT|nr:sensor histidine kinase [Hymenobacter montanus]MBD2769891.1 sensor histidine kinase [Hymenobacter montanus]
MILSIFWRRRGMRYLVVWSGLLSFLFLVMRYQGVSPLPIERALKLAAAITSLFVGSGYVHNWLLRHFFEHRRYGIYGLLTVSLILTAASLSCYVFPLLGSPTSFWQSISNITFILIISAAVPYFSRGIVAQFQIQELRARQLETELSLLKAQVNQHFLFNTLNNLYGLSLAAPDQMPEALLQLAGLMRYQLDSSRQSVVTVGTEAEYLANYIGLEKLRLHHNTQVEFLADLPHPEQPVAPLLLLPLVENCFKHAVGSGGPNTIRISLCQTDAGLTLRTDNSIPPHFHPTPSGLGLPNLRARLAQLYPGGRHQFAVEATATHYAATLQLML